LKDFGRPLGFLHSGNYLLGSGYSKLKRFLKVGLGGSTNNFMVNMLGVSARKFLACRVLG